MPEIRLTLSVPRWLAGRSIPAGTGIVVGFLVLNLLLFLPLYLIRAHEHDFWPFFPPGHPRGPYDWSGPGLGRSLYEYALQLFVRRHNKDVFRVSADWIFLFSSLVLASRFAPSWRRTAAALAGSAYVALLGFLAYSGFIQDLFDRPGTLLDDLLMLDSAWIFARDTWGSADYLRASALLGATVGLGVLVARYVYAGWRWGSRLDRRLVVVGWAILNGYCLLSLSWFGVARDDPVVQLQAKHAYHNWQRSQDVLATAAALDGAPLQAAARLAATVPVRHPDVYLFEIESYGAALWADDDYRTARQGLMRRVRSELEELGLPMLTRFAASPVHGGGSWMSTASALSGLRIGSHSTYWAWKRVAYRYPHLVSTLKGFGYYTLAVQPGSTWAEDLYGYDDVLIRHDFSYDGPFYGFGHVPDQWALDHAFANHWSLHPRPRFLHFVAVSTHFAWEPPPRITPDPAELEGPQPSFLETRPDYVELALTVPQGWKRNFFVTIAYEWELLLAAFRKRVEPGFIALIFGDHQPPFITDGKGDNDVGFHVVTDLVDLAEPLLAAGFLAGDPSSWTPSAATEFRMEAVYPFVLSLLSAKAGDALDYPKTGIEAPAVPAW